MCVVVFFFFFNNGRCYLAGLDKVEAVEQEERQALDEHHVVPVLPDQDEGEGRSTHEKVAEHLQNTGEERQMTVIPVRETYSIFLSA